MLFNDSKYTNWYNSIILRAQNRTLPDGIYIESHHIMPRSLGGSHAPTNLVKLTAREHFICHWLLTKMVTGEEQRKMAYACKRMMHSANSDQMRYKINSKLYDLLKNKLNLILKNRKFTDAWLSKLKDSAKRRAANEGEKEKSIRRNNMITANKQRKGEKRPYQSGENNHFYGVRMVGESNPFFGKKHSQKSLEKMRKPKPKFECPYCLKIIGGESNFKRWHGNNCQQYRSPICQD